MKKTNIIQFEFNHCSFFFLAHAFVQLSHEMKDCYALYCRNYDDAQVIKEKVCRLINGRL